MSSLEMIDDYFNLKLLPVQRSEFEARIIQDPDFAEEVAFYINAKKAAREEMIQEKKTHFRQLYEANTPAAFRTTPIRRIWYYAAAAVFAGLILIGSYFLLQSPSPQEIAGTYIKENLNTLGVTMGGSNDSLQSGLQAFNQGDLEPALQQFESMLASDPANAAALKYAGIVSLRLNKFDKALAYFRRLENQPGLFSNPGKFYQALALMKRNQRGDIEQAKQLLNQVVQLDLEGKSSAIVWLKKL